MEYVEDHYVIDSQLENKYVELQDAGHGLSQSSERQAFGSP